MKELNEVKQELIKLLSENNCFFITLKNGEIVNVDIQLGQDTHLGITTTKLNC